VTADLGLSTLILDGTSWRPAPARSWNAAPLQRIHTGRVDWPLKRFAMDAQVGEKRVEGAD
jgi:hypothetical protein